MGSDGTYDRRYFTSRYTVRDPSWDFYQLGRLAERRLRFLTAARAGSTHYLDAGCGEGRYLRLMAPMSEHVLGIDVSEYALQACRRHNLDVAQASVTALPFPGERFDAMTSMDVLEHLSIEEGLNALAEYWRCLKPGGRLVVVVPNWHHPVIKDEFFSDFTHRTIYTRVSLRNACNRVGFDCVVREEHTLTGVPGVGWLAQRLGRHDLAFTVSKLYSIATRRRLHLTAYAEKPTA